MAFLKADKLSSMTVKPHEYDKYFRCDPEVAHAQLHAIRGDISTSTSSHGVPAAIV